jgi:hypothetical protein
MTVKTRRNTRSLTQADVNDLCRVAQWAWKQAPGNAYCARFRWRGKRYVAEHTLFRLLIYTPDGTLVAACYD